MAVDQVRNKIERLFFDVNLFIPEKILQTYVNEQSRVKNVDPVAFVAHLLPTIAHLMGGTGDSKTEIKFHETWKEPPILYHILVASKSSSKTPVMNVITKEVHAISKQETEDAYRVHREIVQDEEEESPIFNPSSHLRIFDAATGQGILHALASGSGNMLGSIDELTNWQGLTDPMLSTSLLSCFNAMPWRSLTVSHKSVSVEKPYVNLAGNIQTPLMVTMLQKPDPQGMFSRYSLWAVRESHCKRFDLEEQLAPLDKQLDDFSLRSLFQRIVTFHKELKVQYGFPVNSMDLIKAVIRQFNAMSDASEDEDIKSLISKCISKLIRGSGVQCCLRLAAESDDQIETGVVREGVLHVDIQPEDVTRAKRCVLYTIACFIALSGKEEVDDIIGEEGEPGQGVNRELLRDEQPSLPKARKYRRKSEDVPDTLTSSINDLTKPKIAKQLLTWYKNSDENDQVLVTKIHHKRWFVRSNSSPDAEMLDKLIKLVVSHGVVENVDGKIKLLRSSPSSNINSKIEFLREEIEGYLEGKN